MEKDIQPVELTNATDQLSHNFDASNPPVQNGGIKRSTSTNNFIAKGSTSRAADARKIELQEEMIQHTITKDYADVLLIVTGGTLCMVNTENGYMAAPGLANRLKANAIFYDKDHVENHYHKR